MPVVRVKPAFADLRGTITDVLDGIPVECVTLLTTRKGAVRGNHYHKKTTQYAYVIRGRFRLFTQRGTGRVRSRVVKAGEMIVTPPLERHAFVALENSLMVACAHGPRSGRSYESDTYRLATPISKVRRPRR
jgi:quercetin dioxygenase-like cupin family protein